jgi:hypothetical protein
MRFHVKKVIILKKMWLRSLLREVNDFLKTNSDKNAEPVSVARPIDYIAFIQLDADQDYKQNL